MSRFDNGKRYVVYCHTNKIDGKKYVGITCRKPEHRWNNGDGYIGNKHFYRAIQKYGWESFTHEILFSGLTGEEACRKESYLIEKWDLTNPVVGYNMMFGGEIPSHTESTKQKISESNKENSFWRGKRIPDSVREKMSLAKKGKRPKSCKPKPVICLETGVVYQSGMEASMATGVCPAVISRCCNHGYDPQSRKPYKGLHFEFVEVRSDEQT